MSAEVNVQQDDTHAADEAAANQAALDRLEAGGLDAKPAQEPTQEPAPEWCPEKFARYNDDGTFNADMSATALREAHASLESQFTQQQQQQPGDEEAQDQQVADDDDDLDPDDVTKAVEELVDETGAPVLTPEVWDAFTDEFQQSGELSVESMNILKQVGIPEDIVQAYIEGQQARGVQYQSQIASILPGGDTEYNALMDWADTAGLDPAQVNAINAGVTSGDVVQAQMAVRNLKMLYTQANGTGGEPLGGGHGAGSSVSGYASRAQMTEAIRDPRYHKDPAYRAEVEKKIGASDFL